MSGYVLSGDADLDLDDMWEYVTANSVDSCSMPSRYWGGIQASVTSTQTAHPVLFWPVGAFLVTYKTARLPIEIVAVTNG